MRGFGLDPEELPAVKRKKSEVLAYAELHIEQGPVLEAEDLPVGVVTAINGFSRLRVALHGEAGHAGTVPMGLRRDALAAAAECVLAVETIAKGHPELVATVGRIEAKPGAINVIPGEVRMTVADYANAVKVYEKLVNVAPKVAAFHLRLAVAMACYPRTAKLAEREFYEAARIEPDNAEIHYQWGLYYKVMKIKSRAVAEMRTAVRLNPRHKNARTELEQLSPKDSALQSLKKLFR